MGAGSFHGELVSAEVWGARFSIERFLVVLWGGFCSCVEWLLGTAELLAAGEEPGESVGIEIQNDAKLLSLWQENHCGCCDSQASLNLSP